MSTFQCANRPNSNYSPKGSAKAEILPACCMSNVELLESLDWRPGKPKSAESPTSAALDTKREQRLRRAIKAEMLSL
jgi:hypothetical protein